MGAVLRLPLEVNFKGGYHGLRCYVGQTQHGRKEVFQIVYGNDIMDVRGKFVKYMRKE